MLHSVSTENESGFFANQNKQQQEMGMILSKTEVIYLAIIFGSFVLGVLPHATMM